MIVEAVVKKITKKPPAGTEMWTFKVYISPVLKITKTHKNWGPVGWVVYIGYTVEICANVSSSPK